MLVITQMCQCQLPCQMPLLYQKPLSDYASTPKTTKSFGSDCRTPRTGFLKTEKERKKSDRTAAPRRKTERPASVDGSLQTTFLTSTAN